MGPPSMVLPHGMLLNTVLLPASPTGFVQQTMPISGDLLVGSVVVGCVACSSTPYLPAEKAEATVGEITADS